jgi:hypothetical protein
VVEALLIDTNSTPFTPTGGLGVDDVYEPFYSPGTGARE